MKTQSMTGNVMSLALAAGVTSLIGIPATAAQATPDHQDHSTQGGCLFTGYHDYPSPSSGTTIIARTISTTFQCDPFVRADIYWADQSVSNDCSCRTVQYYWGDASSFKKTVHFAQDLDGIKRSFELS